MNKAQPMNPGVDEELIDNLVCGTLSGVEFRKAIVALEANPQKWRDCALAFLQEQALSEDLTQISHSDVDWQQARQNQPWPTTSLKSAMVMSSSNARRGDSIAWFYKFGTLAALVLLGFSMGWISSSVSKPSELFNQSAEPSRSELAIEAAPKFKVDQMSVEQVLPSSKLGSNKFSLVGNSSMSLLPIDEEIPANLAKLESEGRIRIEKNTAIMPVEFDGGTMLVPIQQIRIVPVTFSY